MGAVRSIWYRAITSFLAAAASFTDLSLPSLESLLARGLPKGGFLDKGCLGVLSLGLKESTLGVIPAGVVAFFLEDFSVWVVVCLLGTMTVAGAGLPVHFDLRSLVLAGRMVFAKALIEAEEFDETELSCSGSYSLTSAEVSACV